MRYNPGATLSRELHEVLMTRLYRAAIAIVGMALLVSSQSDAQTNEQQAPPIQILARRVQASATLQRYLESLRAEVLRLDANGDGVIDSADAEIHNAIMTASHRANASVRFMSADLDGDGAVTEAELRQKLEYDQRIAAAMRNVAPPSVSDPRVPNPDDRTSQEIRNLLTADADNDGRVTWAEVIEFLKRQPFYVQSLTSPQAKFINQLLPLASDGKPLSLSEIEAAATAAFLAIDTDGNGTISQDELAAARSQPKPRRKEEQAQPQRSEEQPQLNCGMPAASEKAKVVLLGSGETEALSNVAIGTQDEATGVGTIKVEAGDEPIYLVIVSYQPTIWRFDGAVERIEHVVVTTTRTGLNETDQKSPPLAGVTGLPADRVTFARQSGCIGVFSEVPSIDAAKAAGAVKQQSGKDVAVTAGRFKVAGFRVPSGRVDVIERNPGTQITSAPKFEGDANKAQVQATSNLETIFRWYTPGGLIDVDAKSVVASATAQRYEVAPQEAGLIQLMKSGALTQNPRGEFLIHGKIRFPAALSGRHATKFLLMRSVPMPEGDPGNSLIIAEETGEPIEKRR